MPGSALDFMFGSPDAGLPSSLRLGSQDLPATLRQVGGDLPAALRSLGGELPSTLRTLGGELPSGLRTDAGGVLGGQLNMGVGLDVPMKWRGPSQLAKEAADQAEKAKRAGDRANAQRPGAAAPVGAVAAAGPLGGISLSGLGPENRQTFFGRAMQLGLAIENATGIPAELLSAMAANESNFGRAPGNILGGVKADPSDPNAIWLDTWEQGPNGPYQTRQPFRASGSAMEGMQHVADVLMSGRYAGAYQQLRSGQIDGPGFIQQVNALGYATNPVWATREIIPLMGEAGQYRAGAQQANAALSAPSNAQTPLIGGIPRNQYDIPLDKATADAFCGPYAAQIFAAYYGRYPSVTEALGVAKDVGWTSGAGMAGVRSQYAMLQRLGLPARLVEGAPDWNAVAQSVSAGQPVILNTAGHYFVAQAYDAASGRFDFGSTASILRRAGGQSWFTPQQVNALGMGAVDAAIYTQ